MKKHKLCKGISRKSQISAEFILIISIMFVVLTVFVTLILTRTTDMNEQRQTDSLTALGDSVALEMHTAAGLNDGYKRSFLIPNRILGLDYDIWLRPANESAINTSSLNLQFSLLNNPPVISVNLPKKIKGTIIKGINNLTKENGTICINLPDCG